MIKTLEDALEQNRKLVSKCFHQTIKLNNYEDELKRCKKEMELLKTTCEIVDNQRTKDLPRNLVNKTTAKSENKENFQSELSESQKQLEAMTKKFREAAESFANERKKNDLLNEKLKFQTNLVSEKENKIQKLEKVYAEMVREIEEMRAGKENASKQDEFKIKLEASEAKFRNLIFNVAEKDEKILELEQRMNPNEYNLELKKKDETIIKLNKLTNLLKLKVNQWYVAYGTLRFEQINANNAKKSAEAKKQVLNDQVKELEKPAEVKSCDKLTKADSTPLDLEDVVEKIRNMEIELGSLRKNISTQNVFSRLE